MKISQEEIGGNIQYTFILQTPILLIRTYDCLRKMGPH